MTRRLNSLKSVTGLRGCNRGTVTSDRLLRANVFRRAGTVEHRIGWARGG